MVYVPSRNFYDSPLAVISNCVSILINICFRFAWGRYSITKHFPHFQYTSPLFARLIQNIQHIILYPNPTKIKKGRSTGQLTNKSINGDMHPSPKQLIFFITISPLIQLTLKSTSNNRFIPKSHRYTHQCTIHSILSFHTIIYNIIQHVPRQGLTLCPAFPPGISTSISTTLFRCASANNFTRA